MCLFKSQFIKFIKKSIENEFNNYLKNSQENVNMILNEIRDTRRELHEFKFITKSLKENCFDLSDRINNTINDCTNKFDIASLIIEMKNNLLDSRNNEGLPLEYYLYRYNEFEEILFIMYEQINNYIHNILYPTKCLLKELTITLKFDNDIFRDINDFNKRFDIIEKDSLNLTFENISNYFNIKFEEDNTTEDLDKEYLEDSESSLQTDEESQSLEELQPIKEPLSLKETLLEELQPIEEPLLEELQPIEEPLSLKEILLEELQSIEELSPIYGLPDFPSLDNTLEQLGMDFSN